MSRTQKVVLVLILSTLLLGGLNKWQSSGEKDSNDDEDERKPTEKETEMNA